MDKQKRAGIEFTKYNFLNSLKKKINHESILSIYF